MTRPQTPAPRATVALTPRDIEEIEGIADLGMPIGGTLIGRLCADWRRLTAERDAAAASARDWRDCFAIMEDERDELRAAIATAPAPVPAADVPAFLAHRLNGGR